MIEKLPNYDEFKGEFNEIIDKKLCNLIMESENETLTLLMKTAFQNQIIDNLNEKGELVVNHNQRHNVGRFYPDNDISLIVQARIIKHTIFYYLKWRDIDQVKGHPTIIYEIGKLNNIVFEGIKFYINNFDKICNELIDYYSIEGETPLNKDDVKYLFNMTIYGGSFQTWRDNTINGDIDKGYLPKPFANKPLHTCYVKFKTDCDKFKTLLLNDNSELLNRIKLITKMKIK